MEHPGRGDWASDFQDELPGEGRPAELPSGVMPGQSGDEDGNEGALLVPACPQHRGDSGGGKLTPPTVRPIQYAGTQAEPEWTAPGHGTVCKGEGAEEKMACGGGGKGEFGAGLIGIRETYKECFGISIPGEVIGGGRR